MRCKCETVAPRHHVDNCSMLQDPFSPAKQPQDVFSPPPLERFEPPAQPQPTAQPQPNGALHAEPAPAPVRNGLSSNGLQNGFTEFVSTKVRFSISISIILYCGNVELSEY